MKLNALIIILLFTVLSACSKEPAETTAERVDRIAAEFVNAYYAHYPEEAFESGYPDAPSDRFGDRSAESQAAWDHKVDQWLQQLDSIDPSALNSTPSAVTYLFALDRLQATQDQRICRMELWNISPTWTGWQTTAVDTLAVQPVETPAQRDAALARMADLPRFIDTEISNLREGVESGYLAPRTNVAAVAEQITSLLAMPTKDSPLFNPAARSSDSTFIERYRDILETDVQAALTRFRDFLIEDYEG